MLLRPLAVLALAAALQGQELARRPSFVVLLADDLGWTDLACHGSTFYETPHIDALAASGASFIQGYATAPVCSPTRVSLMTGKYPARLHTTDYFGGRRKGKLLPAEYRDSLPLEQDVLPEMLRRAGYRTCFVGKWHLGGEGFGPLEQGFERNVGGFARGSPPGGYFSPYENPALEDGPEGEHLTERLTDEALRFLREVDEDEPFLLYMSYYAVHTPLQTKPDLKAKYAAKAAALPELDGPRFVPEGEREARQVQDHAVYAGMVQSLDESVGRVLAALEELGRANETVVVFTSDNGGLSTSEGSPTSNVPLRAGKGWMYEGGIRVPWIVRWPGVTRAGADHEAPIASVDLKPTLLEIAGVEVEPDPTVDGVSFVPVLRGAPHLERDALYWHYPHYGNQGGSPSGAIRRGRFKLIEFFEDGRCELYDLHADLGERVDLAAQMPEVAKALKGALHRWRESVAATMPTPNSEYRDG